ncbi:TetR/AcrR family transcriptional regulator [Rhizobium sp. CNPSo 3464]|uniref:TetR/AcrR family transcriptional regulator n=1 Tax=Rhizobium sp. CNPSo 3464 TaxID=3021406 RepID=UPI0025517559|nr:TetR/AcrR family transcriptional regulator [Rhizobium sp. CNPSo 3464]MDK4740848.1 TetR/AcrR family transcriptional regulator [Rhizobium sp. CNPSo 3464]
MENATPSPLNRRKLPRQVRSIVTVNAIFEATIQVLLSDGPIRLNTTRVARRAGVSVGTLYQYFPHKQALLFAVLERHLALLAEAVEKASDENLYAPVETIARAVVKAYLDARMAQTEVAPALYLIATELDARELIESASRRSERAIEAMLSTASDGRFADPHVIAQTMTAVIYGTVPAFCKRVMPPAVGSEAEKQLTIMFHSYLVASSTAA